MWGGRLGTLSPQFDEAKQYYHKAVQIDPNDPESYYSVAFIDWTQAYKFRQDERNKESRREAEQAMYRNRRR